MKRILKFPLNSLGAQTNIVFAASELLSIQIQDGIVTLWVETDSDLSSTTHYHTFVVPTGRVFDSLDYKHFTTLQDANGFVWHVYVKEENI